MQSTCSLIFLDTFHHDLPIAPPRLKARRISRFEIQKRSKMENDKGVSASTGNNNNNVSVGSNVKKGVLDAATSMWEGLQYAKALIVSQLKKLRAKDEKELMEADLQADRMQADAADSAEAEKKMHEHEALGIRSS